MMCLTIGCQMLSNSVASRASRYEKLEKQWLYAFWVRPKLLLVRDAAPRSEMLRLLCRVIATNVDRRMPLPLPTQQDSVELRANSALNCWCAEWCVT